MIKVLLADDHAIMRDGLKEILATTEGIEIIGEAANGNEVLSALQQIRPDLLLMDLSMPGISGISLLEQVKHLYPDLPVMILSMLDDAQIVFRAIQSGAEGYITKDRSASELLAALNKVAAGGRYIDPIVAEKIVFYNAGADMPHNKLSSREMDVYKMLVKGKSVNEIAEILFISNKTVSSHKVNLMKKMGMESMSELIYYSVQNNLFA